MALKGNWVKAQTNGGRKRKYDYSEVLRLREQGLSYRQIEAKTGVPRGSIFHAIRGQSSARP